MTRRRIQASEENSSHKTATEIDGGEEGGERKRLRTFKKEERTTAENVKVVEMMLTERGIGDERSSWRSRRRGQEWEDNDGRGEGWRLMTKNKKQGKRTEAGENND